MSKFSQIALPACLLLGTIAQGHGGTENLIGSFKETQKALNASIHGLGTNNCGKEFHEVAYKNLMDSGLPDRIKWMDWPVDESYEQNSNVTHIENLQGALLLTVGELDTNVDPASTYQVVDALIKADKDFEYFMIPGAEHGIGESPYLRRKRIEFFQKHLSVDH